jgi:hypothetical protein
MSRKPNYGEAIMWLIVNERLDWMSDAKPTFPDTVWMTSELFGVPYCKCLRDIRATLGSEGKIVIPQEKLCSVG